MDKPIRTALVCTSLNQVGGKTSHFKNMYLGLKDKGIDIIIVVSSSLEKEYRTFMEREGIKREDVIFIPRYKKWLVIPFIVSLKSIFKKRRINIVHTFQMQSDIFGGIAASLAGINCTISHQESRVIEENIPGFKKILYRSINAVIKDLFKKTIVVSEGLRKELISGGFRPEEKIEIIRLGIDSWSDS